MPSRAEILEQLADLHAEVDARTASLAVRHGGRLRCARGCSGCCLDDLTVFEVEAERIRSGIGESLRGSAPGATGACVFLDGEGACRVHPLRPYVCRTQGLPLRWLEPEAGIERRDICPLNEAGPPLEGLSADDCYTLGPVEGRLAGLQAGWQRAADGSAQPLRRVALRDLFDRLR